MVVLSHEFLTWIHTPRSLQTVSGDPVNVKFYPNIMSLYGFCGEEFPQCLLDEQRGLSPQESTRTTAVGQQHRSLSSCIRSTRGTWCLPCARYWGVCRDLQRPSISWGPGMSPSQVDSSHVCTKFTLVLRSPAIHLLDTHGDLGLIVQYSASRYQVKLGTAVAH